MEFLHLIISFVNLWTEEGKTINSGVFEIISFGDFCFVLMLIA